MSLYIVRSMPFSSLVLLTSTFCPSSQAQSNGSFSSSPGTVAHVLFEPVALSQWTRFVPLSEESDT